MVIGLPRRLNGEPNEQTARVQTLARLRGAEIDLPIALQDERLTSHEAEERLAVAGEATGGGASRRSMRWPPPIILQDYLDGQPRPLPMP